MKLGRDLYVHSMYHILFYTTLQYILTIWLATNANLQAAINIYQGLFAT